MEHAAGRTAAGKAADDDALDALRFHWGDAYEIGRDDERGWWARRRDGFGGDLSVAGPDELYEAIAADYALKPVPRSAASADRS
jgi:hypothetical protein